MKVRQKKRPEGNFILCMQAALKHHYDTQPVGLGGVFVLMNGKARIHVMVWTSDSFSLVI